MKFQFSKSIARYFIEAILIFVSVYAAFVLESKRSIEFERKILAGRIERLNLELRYDSLKYEDLLLSANKKRKNGPITPYNLLEDIRYDSLALAYLKSNSEEMIDSIFYWWKEMKILDVWDEYYIESLEKESSIVSQLIEQQYLFLDIDFRGLLWNIVSHRRVFVEVNATHIQLRKDLENEFIGKLAIFDPDISEDNKRAFISSTHFKNALNIHMNNCKDLVEYIRGTREYAYDDRRKVEKELEAQTQKL